MIESTHTHWMCNAKQSRQRRLSAAKGTQASKEGFDFGSISVIVPFYAGGNRGQYTLSGFCARMHLDHFSGKLYNKQVIPI